LVAAHTSTQRETPLAIVLGLNEIASAVAVNLHGGGYAVIMVHDAGAPVIRRGMAFFDALFDGKATLGGVTAVNVDSSLAARSQVRAQECICVTRLDLSELLIIGDIDVLIDARVHSDIVTPRLRKLARISIGIGNRFISGEDCDVTVALGGPEAAHARAVDRTLVMRSPVAGRWHTPLDIGVRIYKGFPLGYLGSTIIKAPVDGILRGIARDDTSVPGSAELIEISTGVRGGRWWGLDAQGVRTGAAVQHALHRLGADNLARSGKRLRLVHSR
jgi:hypothetical protein